MIDGSAVLHKVDGGSRNLLRVYLIHSLQSGTALKGSVCVKSGRNEMGNETWFDQAAFSASAAALVASHAMSDAVWKTYFPELPAKQPELRTVLIKLHGEALAGHPLNLTDARSMVANVFGVEVNTAKKWLKQLEDLKFLSRIKGSRKGAFYLVPSKRAKTGLFHVGEEYLVCLRLVSQPLKDAIHRVEIDVSDVDWLGDVKKVLEIDIQDYPTI